MHDPDTSSNTRNDDTICDGVIVLRPLTIDDADAHLRADDAELARWLGGGPATPHRIRRYLNDVETSWAFGGPLLGFGIHHVDSSALAGTLDIQLGRSYLTPRQANIAYGLYAAWRGIGLATRAVRLAVGFLARRDSIDEAVIRVHPDNHASAAVARRAGFGLSHQVSDVHGKHDWYVAACGPKAVRREDMTEHGGSQAPMAEKPELQP